jgi:hypothetical protein
MALERFRVRSSNVASCCCNTAVSRRHYVSNRLADEVLSKPPALPLPAPCSRHVFSISGHMFLARCVNNIRRRVSVTQNILRNPRSRLAAELHPTKHPSLHRPAHAHCIRREHRARHLARTRASETALAARHCDRPCRRAARLHAALTAAHRDRHRLAPRAGFFAGPVRCTLAPYVGEPRRRRARAAEPARTAARAAATTCRTTGSAIAVAKDELDVPVLIERAILE